MPYLLQKSKTNFLAAEILQEEGKYCAVAHCAYYSCLQLYKHILLNNCDVSEDEIEQERQKKSESLNRKLGSHEIIIALIKEKCSGMPYEQKREINSAISGLKDARIKSDYQNIEITQFIGFECLSNHNAAITKIKEWFNLN
jgi:hypothetical protein